MIPRVLEPELMDTALEAADYDAMDHTEVNRRFVDDLLAFWQPVPVVGDCAWGRNLRGHRSSMWAPGPR